MENVENMYYSELLKLVDVICVWKKRYKLCYTLILVIY